MTIWIKTDNGVLYGPFENKSEAFTHLTKFGWKYNDRLGWILDDAPLNTNKAEIVAREIHNRKSLPIHSDVEIEMKKPEIYSYGILLNELIYPFGPFDNPEEAAAFLKEKGFTQVTETNFIFSPNGEFDAQFAKIGFFPDFIPPEKIKERMNRKEKK